MVGVDGEDGVPHTAVAFGVVPGSAQVGGRLTRGGLDDGDIALEVAAFEVRVARIELLGGRQFRIGFVALGSRLERRHECMVDTPAVGAGDVTGGQIETHGPRPYAVGAAGSR